MLIVALAALAVFALIWLGYPLLIRVLGALRRPWRGDQPDEVPSVSVVLASRDDTSAIRSRVANLLQDQYPAHRIEIVVALDATRGQSAEQHEQFGPEGLVRTVAGDAPGGKSATLNAGVRAAANDILVFTDTAQRFEPGAIRELVAQLSNPRLGAVSGMLEIASGNDRSTGVAERYWRYERWLRRWEARLHSCVGVTGAIYAMPRRLWEPLPTGLILDDLYLPMRLVLQGWRVGFTADARAHDARRFAPAQEYRRKVRTLTGIFQVCRWLPGVLNPARNPIWLQFVFHKLLRLLTPYVVLVALAAIASLLLTLLISWRAASYTLYGIAAVVAILCLIPRIRRVLKGQLAWGLALQGSIVVATVNGVRGKWDVWR